MKLGLKFVAALAVLCLAGQPAAAAIALRVTGTITQQLTPGAPAGFGAGDEVVVEARFNERRAVAWDDLGYNVAFLYGLPTSGEEFYRITVGGHVLKTTDEIYDGFPSYFRGVYDFDGRTISEMSGGAPAIGFGVDHVLGLSGYMSPSGPAPEIELGSGFGGTDYLFRLTPGGPFDQSIDHRGRLSGSFLIDNINLYTNTYDGPAFRGVWNFDASVVQFGVPEPGSWALMIGGFALAGVALRGRRARRA